MADNFVIDFSNVEEFDPGTLPIGVYLVEVAEANLGKSSNDKPYLNLRLKVLEPEEYEGRTIFDRIFLTPESMWRAKKALRAFEFEVDGPLNMREVAYDIVGREVEVRTKVRKLPRDGKEVTDVAAYLDATEIAEGGKDEDVF